MKIKQILFLLILSITTSLNAQKFQGGIVGGIAATQVTGDKLSGYNHPGAQFGVFTQLALSEKSALRLSMYYIQKGSRKNASDVDLDSYVQRLNYIEIPLMYQFKPFSKQPKLSFNAGLSYAYLFSSTDIVDGDKVPSYSVDPRYSYDFSIHGGGAWKFTEKWSVALTYSYSILPIRGMPSGSNMAHHDRKQYNDVVLISVLYYF